MTVDINREVHELRGVFPTATTQDFFRLDNGNTGAIVEFESAGPAELGRFQVLIEYLHDFPGSAPRAWIMGGKIANGTPHCYDVNNDQARICYIYPQYWRPSYTTYDVATMVKSWIFAYCWWKRTGKWGWNEKQH